MKRVIIESPYAGKGDTPEERAENTERNLRYLQNEQRIIHERDGLLDKLDRRAVQKIWPVHVKCDSKGCSSCRRLRPSTRGGTAGGGVGGAGVELRGGTYLSEVSAMKPWHAYDTVAMFAFAAILSSPKHYHALIVCIEVALLAGMFIGRHIERSK